MPTSTTLTVGMDVNLTTLDPASLSQNPAQSVASHIMEPLFRQNAELEFVPALALSYERPDPITWRFRLRDGITFHNGEPFTADDVVYNLNRVKDTSRSYVAAVNTFFFENVVEAVKVDRLTVDFITKTPTAFFLANVQRLLIIPQSAEEAGASWGTNPVGTGPFKFVEMIPGERVVIERNNDYWGPKPSIDRLVVRPLIEEATRVAALEAGEVHFINSVPLDSLDVLESNPDVRIESTASAQTVGLVLRTESSPLDDVRVRQAIAHAIDEDALAQEIFGGTAVAADSPFAPGLLGRTTFQDYAYDPALSRQLLAEAGYPDGIKLTFGIPLGNYLASKPAGEAIAGMLQEAGIDVTGYEELEWGQFFPTAVENQAFQIYFYGLGSLDPSFLVYFQTLSLYHDWAPAGVTDLVDAATAGPPDDSVAPLEQLQEMMWEDLPWVFLYYEPQIVAMAPNVDGVPARVDGMYDFRDAVLNGE